MWGVCLQQNLNLLNKSEWKIFPKKGRLNRLNGDGSLKMKFTAVVLFFSFALTLGFVAQAETGRSAYVSNVDGVEVHTVKWSGTPLRVALWYEKSSGPRRQVLKESQVVLFVHGATISGKLSAGYPMAHACQYQ